MTTQPATYVHDTHMNAQEPMFGELGGRSVPLPRPTMGPVAAWSMESAYRGPSYAGRPQVMDTADPALLGIPSGDVDRRQLDWGRYWTGSALTMVVAALLGSIAMILVQGVFRQGLFFVGTGGAAVALSVGVYAVAVAGLAGFGSLLFVAITFLAPRPGIYFGWIGALITVLALVLPFTTDAALSSQAILAVINAILGAVIIMLVPLAAVFRRRPAV